MLWPFNHAWLKHSAYALVYNYNERFCICFACGMFSSDRYIKSLLVTKHFTYYIKAISYTKCHLVRKLTAPLRHLRRQRLPYQITNDHHLPSCITAAVLHCVRKCVAFGDDDCDGLTRDADPIYFIAMLQLLDTKDPVSHTIILYVCPCH